MLKIIGKKVDKNFLQINLQVFSLIKNLKEVVGNTNFSNNNVAAESFP